MSGATLAGCCTAESRLLKFKAGPSWRPGENEITRRQVADEPPTRSSAALKSSPRFIHHSFLDEKKNDDEHNLSLFSFKAE